MAKLTHLDDQGAARMVDVTGKEATDREAVAEAEVLMSEEAFAAVRSRNSQKGDVLATARIAGIMAAKRTSELIPLCHPIALANAGVTFELDEVRRVVKVHAMAKTTGQTGVEMEALTAASIAALTIYDMIKAVDREAQVAAVRLVKKSGGKSGTFVGRASDNAGRGRATAEKPRKAKVLSTAAPQPRNPRGAQREAFRAFMTSHRLRATEWAKEAGVAPSQIYAYLTGRSHRIPEDVIERLARAARVRVEDLFR
jgi:cyclic pyranopterin monophosphate synthase